MRIVGRELVDIAKQRVSGKGIKAGIDLVNFLLCRSCGFFLNDYTLQAKDMATLPGSSLWSFTGDGGLDSAPLVVNGVVYVGSLSGMLYGLGEATGAVLWKTNVGAPINAPDDQNNWMTTGMAAGEGVLVVAAGNRLVAYTSGTSPPNRSCHRNPSSSSHSGARTVCSLTCKLPARTLSSSLHPDTGRPPKRCTAGARTPLNKSVGGRRV